jgi:hypothetical protein
MATYTPVLISEVQGRELNNACHIYFNLQNRTSCCPKGIVAPHGSIATSGKREEEKVAIYLSWWLASGRTAGEALVVSPEKAAATVYSIVAVKQAVERKEAVETKET